MSIVTEKTKHFRSLLEGTDVAVESFHGGARPVDTWNIAICTIEKVFLPFPLAFIHPGALLTVGEFVNQFNAGGEYC